MKINLTKEIVSYFESITGGRPPYVISVDTFNKEPEQIDDDTFSLELGDAEFNNPLIHLNVNMKTHMYERDNLDMGRSEFYVSLADTLLHEITHLSQEDTIETHDEFDSKYFMGPYESQPGEIAAMNVEASAPQNIKSWAASIIRKLSIQPMNESISHYFNF